MMYKFIYIISILLVNFVCIVKASSHSCIEIMVIAVCQEANTEQTNCINQLKTHNTFSNLHRRLQTSMRSSYRFEKQILFIGNE